MFDVFDPVCLKWLGKFAISLWHLKKEVRNEVRDLTVLAGSNTFTICYTSNILLPLTHFLSQYGIHKKPFLYLIICVILSKGRYMQVDLFAKILTYYKTGLRHAYFWKCYLKFHCPKVRDLEVYESKKILFQVIKVWYCLQYFFAHENWKHLNRLKDLFKCIVGYDILRHNILYLVMLVFYYSQA